MFFEVVASDTAIPDVQRKTAKLDGPEAKALTVICNEQPAAALAAASVCSTWHVAAVTNQFHVTIESRGHMQSNSENAAGTISTVPLSHEKPCEATPEALVFPCRNASTVALRHHLVSAPEASATLPFSASNRAVLPNLSEASLAKLVASDIAVIASAASAWSRPADQHQPTWPRIVNASHLPTIALLAHVKRDSRRLLLVLTPYDPARSSTANEQSMAALYQQQQQQQQQQSILNRSAHHADPNQTLQNISAIAAANQSLLDRNPVIPDVPPAAAGGEPSLIAALDDSKASSVADGQRRPMGIVYTLSACQVSSAARFVTVSHGGEWVAVMEPKTCVGSCCPLVVDPSQDLRVIPCGIAPIITTAASDDDRTATDSSSSSSSATLVWTSIVPQFSQRVRIGSSHHNGDSGGGFFLVCLFSDGVIRAYAALRNKPDTVPQRRRHSSGGDGAEGPVQDVAESPVYSPTSGATGDEDPDGLALHVIACTPLIENATSSASSSKSLAALSRLRENSAARPSSSIAKARAGGAGGGSGALLTLSPDATRVARCPSGEVLCCAVSAGVVVFVAIAHNLPITLVFLPRPSFVGKHDSITVDEIVWAGQKLSSGVLVRAKVTSAVVEGKPQNRAYFLCWAGPAGQAVVVEARPFHLPCQLRHVETPVVLPASSAKATKARTSTAQPWLDAALRDGHFLLGENVAGCTRFRIHAPGASAGSSWVDVLVSRCPSDAAQCEFALLSCPPQSIAAFVTLATFAGVASHRRSLMAQFVFSMLSLDSNRFLDAAATACRAYGAAILAACPPNGTNGLSKSHNIVQLVTAASDAPTATSATGQDLEVFETVVEHLAAHGAVSALLSSVAAILVPPLVGTREVTIIADMAIVGLGSMYASTVSVDSDVQRIRTCSSQTLQLALSWRKTHEERLAQLEEGDAAKTANGVAQPSVRGLEAIEADFLALVDAHKTTCVAVGQPQQQPARAAKPLLASDWELLWPLLLIRHGSARTLELMDQASLAMRQFNDENSVAVQQLLSQCKAAIW